MGEEILHVIGCLSYFSVAMRRHHNQGKVYSFNELESMSIMGGIMITGKQS